MRFLTALLMALCVAVSHAEKIILIPLDSRPAAGQFALMIGKVAGVEVEMPPYELLGRFTTPGRPDQILEWLRETDLSDVSAVIVSADMVEYGGLIESRLNSVSTEAAISRIKRLSSIVRSHPSTKLYVFSATMRLLPTATKEAEPWRLQLGKYEEAKAKWEMTHNAESGALAKRLRPKLGDEVVAEYENTRKRNLSVQKQLLYMQAKRMFDYLIVGQDDARPYGPHVGETALLKKMVGNLGLGGSVYFCEGVDQHASVLMSRALLDQAKWTPKVRVVYSDENGKYKFNPFESKPIKDSLTDQLLASGAVPAVSDEDYDYTLYLNTPGHRSDRFAEFLSSLKADLDQGFPTAVADIDLAKDGTANPELFEALWDNARIMKLLSYAGWNTAGNTMGTTIPAANVYLMARRINSNPLSREVAQREFLLHRFVNDYAYHKYTRPAAYRMVRERGGATTEEMDSDVYQQVNEFVQQDLAKRLEDFFRDQFLGKRFFAGTTQYAFSGITDIRIFLPWPRAYEVRLEFHLQPQIVNQPTALKN